MTQKTQWAKLYALSIFGGLSWLGSALTTFTVILRDKDAIGAEGVSLLLLAMAVPTIVLSPIAGYLADRYSTRTVVIPLLIVMFNNRAYYNDWHHQIRMAWARGTDESKAHIGMDLFGPEPDFAGLARSMGVWGEGPIEDPKDVRGALMRALEVVKSGKPALVDTITRHR